MLEVIASKHTMKPHTYLKACLANEGSGILKHVRFDPIPPKEKDSQSTKFIRHSFKKLFLVYKAKRKQDVLEKRRYKRVFFLIQTKSKYFPDEEDGIKCTIFSLS